MSIIFAGTDSICNPTIHALSASITLLIAPPSKPKGRGNKIQDPDTVAFVKANHPHIKILQTENINNELEMIKSHHPVAILVFSFAQFFKKEILSSYPIFNIHTSLLPKYRGASPIHAALLHQDKVTGVCIQRMQLKLDTGPVLLEKKVTLGTDEDFTSLKEKLSLEASTLANEWLKQAPHFPAGKTQDESLASYAGIIKKEDGKLIASNSALQALGKIRGFCEWPGAFIHLDSKNFKILKALAATESCTPGLLCHKNKKLLLGFSDASLEILEIQPESKPKLTAQNFINGYQQYLGRNFL